MGEDCGNFTYISTSGCSVIDYVIVSRNLLHLSLSLHVADKTESKHMLVELFVQTEKEGAEKVRKVIRLKSKNMFGVQIKVTILQRA